MDMGMRVFFSERREQKRKRKKSARTPRGMSRHHREAVKNGGTNTNGNVIVVPKKAHGYYHAFFGIRLPWHIVQYLNQFWLPLRVTVIAIPTERLTEVLAELKRREVLTDNDIERLGITEDHLRFHGTKTEQEIRAPWYLMKKRRLE